MKTIFLIAFLILAELSCSAQVNSCGYKVSKRSKQNYLEQFQSYNSNVFKSYDSFSLEVPVVFHIIQRSGNSMVSDSMILKELVDLNRDFQLLNSDSNLLAPEFKALVGNPHIKFKLATIDPNGNPTSGIVRKNPSRNNFTFRRSIFYEDPIWNHERYLNVYIGNIRNGNTRGYVNSEPWSSSSSDAIALHYEDIGESTRLLTHETGHWFGLWHIVENGCSNMNDGIGDTPKQKSFTNNCPTLKRECSNNCLIMNYMDYSRCRVTFTKGQVLRMQEVVYKFRTVVLTNR